MQDLYDYNCKEMARYPKMYTDLHPLPLKRKPLKVYLLYGPPRTGKTFWFFENCNPNSWWRCPLSNGTQWYDGYHGQQWVLLDDFAGDMPLVRLLQLLDPYPLLVPVKGGFTDFSSVENIVITTNIHPADWYDWYRGGKDRSVQYESLADRLKYTYDFHYAHDDSRFTVERCRTEIIENRS